MNIPILQGSPRANGNTAWMAEECKKAAEAAGPRVTLVNVVRKKIAGCMACEYCHGKGNGACVQKDDMQELYPLLETAEALVLASPVYWGVEDAGIVTDRLDEQKTDGALAVMVPPPISRHEPKGQGGPGIQRRRTKRATMRKESARSRGIPMGG